MEWCCLTPPIGQCSSIPLQEDSLHDPMPIPFCHPNACRNDLYCSEETMLTDEHIQRYAKTLIWGLKTARTAPFRKNDIVLIRYDRPAIELMEILYDSLLAQGFNPVTRMLSTPKMETAFYTRSGTKQLSFIAPGDKELYRNLNGSIAVLAPESITHLQGIDPFRIGKSILARKPLRDISVEREQQGLFGWTLCAYPTEEQARHAGIDLQQYSDQIIKACFLDQADPVAEWKAVYRKAAAIKKWLNALDIRAYHIESKNMDLTIDPGKSRRWIGVTGHNIPSFELFLSPDWRGTEGVYFADQPSYRSGNLVESVRLEFRKGKVVSATAAAGESFLKKQIEMDPGACRIGEFSLTDKRFSRIDHFMANTLFDENFGGQHGNCHIALGASYADTYSGDPAELTRQAKARLGFNDSALHWDLVNTEPKRVTALLKGSKRMVIYEDGMFKGR
jgi:aminopeptidase